jgi:hypothetical protein
MIPFLAPNDYREEIIDRENKVNMMRGMIEKLMAGEPGEAPMNEE